ncbi:hypothetical protein [Streptomyces leeuwenhoekii]|jgi:hypothetical protein|uniref:Secreted Protein n=1 Tax=Streptomyces leeuwenhoekii TaxID=1437453 RepID=A0A0F7VWV0_STRLW|nr:hypothetical protein [Streptomyces leeuwenhoekii]CQR64245.1 Hypothetical Protein sle_47870 [Streptomyces leeuwenhoekii]
MAIKKALACTFAALALAGGVAGSASAADNDTAKFDNDEQLLSCDTVEIIDIPILSSANNNIDCSENVKQEKKSEVTIVDESDKVSEANLFLKKADYR